MISGRRNCSPQYSAMGQGTQVYANNQHPFSQQPQLQFLAGGSVGVYPQMSRGLSMMPNQGPALPTVMQCNMQHGFRGGGSYGYSGNSAPIIHHPHNYHQKPPQAQPQVVHYQLPQNYIQQSYISPMPPSVSNKGPSSGFINGIKNMVKGFIQPLNCDFYSDHHKYYNPKYRNNYMRQLGPEHLAYVPQQPEQHVKSRKIDLEMARNPQRKCAASTNVPKPSRTTSPPEMTEIVAIFSSEDFPELPAPRRSRSITPAKTEKTTEGMVEERTGTIDLKPQSESIIPAPHPTPKGTFFEIMCTSKPCGRRPTFGGRLKVVPPPFSLNKSQTCRARCQMPKSHDDCDTEEDSFVIFPNERPEDCLLTSFGACRIPRQRQMSECSDDSFVVFFAEDADEDDDEDDDLDSDEETSTDDEEEEDESDSESDEEIDNGTDVVDSSFLGRNKTDRNKCAGRTPLCPEDDCTGAEHGQLDSGFDEKKVTFNTKPPEVHVMHAWNYAYRAARKSKWEDFARDRTRFQQRIERTSVYLNPILTPEHREKIYRTRFCDDAGIENTQQQINTKLTSSTPAETNIVPSDDNQRLPKLTKLSLCARF